MKTVISNGITLGLDEQTFHVSIDKKQIHVGTGAAIMNRILKLHRNSIFQRRSSYLSQRVEDWSWRRIYQPLRRI